MARTYLSTLSPRRRWGIASAAAGLALAATFGLGEPWGFSAIAGLPNDGGVSSVPLLARTLQVFHWTTASATLGGSKPWIAAFVLDGVWPLLILIGVRALAGGLAIKRAHVSLIVGVWSIATLTGAFAGLVAGLVDHSAVDGLTRVAFGSAGAQSSTGDVLTLQAATMALVGVLIGWLPGVAAALAYSVGRTVPEPETSSTSSSGTSLSSTSSSESGLDANESTKILDPGGETLSYEGLEEMRRVQREGLAGHVTREGDDGRLPEPRSSAFFNG